MRHKKSSGKPELFAASSAAIQTSFFAYPFRCVPELADHLNVRCLFALRAGRHFERNALVFFQRLETIGLDRGEVCEEILAAFVRSDEAETFGVIEPFNSTCCHYISYFS